MSKLRPDPSKLPPDPRVTLKDEPPTKAGPTPGEVPLYITPDAGKEAVDLCRAFELTLSRVPRNQELEALYWQVREFLVRAGVYRG